MVAYFMLLLFMANTINHSFTCKPEQVRERCGVADNKLTGGYNVCNDYPWFVSLTNGTNSSCAASVVHQNWVLTAAHCVESNKENPEKILLTFGNADGTIDEPGEVARRPLKVYLHPVYGLGRTKEYDFALVKFEEPLSFNEFVNKIDLPPGDCSQYCYPGADVFMAGFGELMFGMKPQILQESIVNIYHPSFCREDWGVRFSDNMICAGWRKSGFYDAVTPCEGDEGAPLMEYADGKYTLCGVFSFRRGRCGSAARHPVFSKVCKASDWIEGIINCQEEPVEGFCPSMCDPPCRYDQICVGANTCHPDLGVFSAS